MSDAQIIIENQSELAKENLVACSELTNMIVRYQTKSFALVNDRSNGLLTSNVLIMGALCFLIGKELMR